MRERLPRTTLMLMLMQLTPALAAPVWSGWYQRFPEHFLPAEGRLLSAAEGDGMVFAGRYGRLAVTRVDAAGAGQLGYLVGECRGHRTTATMRS